MKKTDSAEYWRSRAKRREAEAKKMGDELNKEILEQYEKAAKDIRNKISEFYVKYADKYGLTKEQSMKILSRSEFKEWKKSLEEYVDEINNETNVLKKAELKARLDALSYNSRISRLEALKEQTGMSINALSVKMHNHMTDGFKDILETSKAKKAYDLSERGLIPAIEFREKIFDENLVKEVLSYPWSGADYSERLWKNTSKLAFELKQELANGMTGGTALPQMAKNISEKMGQSFKVSERLVETETSRIHEEAQFKVYEAAGIEEYEFMAELEKTTCSRCAALDGKHFKLKDRKTGENCNPMHPHCHCTTVEYNPDEELDYINSGLKYEKRKTWPEWWEEQKKLYGEEKMNNELKKLKNKSADKKQYEKYKEILGEKNMPKNLDEFQKLKYNNSEIFEFYRLDYSRQNKLLQNPELRLPNAEKATADDRKFTEYLFNPENKRGFAKGNAFTSRLGYNKDNYEKLKDEILKRATKYPAEHKGDNDYGSKYEQKIVIYGEKQKPANVLVGWLVDKNGVHMTTVHLD